MDKKQQIEFLKEVLNSTIKMYLENEVNYRSTTMAVMANGSKIPDQLNAIQTQSRQAKKALELKIRNLRGLIEEINKGEFEV